MIFQPNDAVILPVPHVQQQHDGECLAACVSMCLHYLNRPHSYSQLITLLDIQVNVGAPFSNIRRLQQINCPVVYRQYGALQELYAFLVDGWPCIASVQTSDLPYWNQINVHHVVLVTGMDRNRVYLNDPDLPAGPIPVTIGDFDLAWLAQDEAYAIIGTQD